MANKQKDYLTTRDAAEHLNVVVSTLTPDEIKIRGGLPPDVLLLKKPVLFEELETLVRKKMKAA